MVARQLPKLVKSFYNAFKVFLKAFKENEYSKSSFGILIKPFISYVGIDSKQ